MVQVNKYTIQDFNIILNSMIIEKIDDDIKNKIDNLSQHLVIDDKDKDKIIIIEIKKIIIIIYSGKVYVIFKKLK